MRLTFDVPARILFEEEVCDIYSHELRAAVIAGIRDAFQEVRVGVRDKIAGRASAILNKVAEEVEDMDDADILNRILEGAPLE